MEGTGWGRIFDLVDEVLDEHGRFIGRQSCRYWECRWQELDCSAELCASSCSNIVFVITIVIRSRANIPTGCAVAGEGVFVLGLGIIDDDLRAKGSHVS